MVKTKVAILGAGFISDIHLESYHWFIPEAEITAVYARDRTKAKAFAEKHSINTYFENLDVLLAEADCLVFDICLSNFFHAIAFLKIASKNHDIIEKLLADRNYCCNYIYAMANSFWSL